MLANVTTTGDVYSTSNTSLSYCEIFQPTNPYCGVFGAKEIVNVIFLSIVALVGLFGNLLVISSIVYDKKVHHYGNVFIINLAVADVIVGFAATRNFENYKLKMRLCFKLIDNCSKTTILCSQLKNLLIIFKASS